MNDNPLAQLAQRDVPPLPDNFEHQVHARVNDALLGTHLADLVLRAAPWALWQLAQAGWGLLTLTLTGDFPRDGRRRPRG